MKGLERVPSTTELLQAYNLLQSDTSIDMERMALYSQWARLDPRFAEILVSYIAKHWSEIQIGNLIDALSHQPWPKAILVLFRFSALILPARDSKTLKHLISAIDEAFVQQPYQLFFIPLQRPNMTVIQREVELRTEPYTLSGFLGSQPLLTHSKIPEGRTLLSKQKRLMVLESLLKKKTTLTIKEYRQACGNLISTRQAQRDLSSHKNVSSRGFTRNRIYISK